MSQDPETSHVSRGARVRTYIAVTVTAAALGVAGFVAFSGINSAGDASDGDQQRAEREIIGYDEDGCAIYANTTAGEIDYLNCDM